jgi:hydroxyethylthiazole kinase-like uncharacterized protein yjeF
VKIFSSEQIHAWDRATIRESKITPLALMERAATTCFDWILENIAIGNRLFTIFCGVGNNGGDGLVIARKLWQKGFRIQVYVVQFREKQTDEFLANLKRLKELTNEITILDGNTGMAEPEEDTIVIDAIFGTGIKKPPAGFVKDLIVKINKMQSEVISIDMPSGLPTDEAAKDREAIIQAQHTLTFQAPKTALLLPDNESFTGNMHIIPIGLSAGFEQKEPSNSFYTDASLLRPIYKKRKKFSHKGDFGHCLIMGGSYGKIGAAVLATRAALHIGTGLVTAYVPKCGYEIMQISVPEAMTEVDSDCELEYFNYKCKPTAIGIGVGMGTSTKSQEGLTSFLKSNKTPLVVDADALNILAMHKELLKLLPPKSILTPHPKELARLIGTWNDDYEKMEMVTAFSKTYDCVLLVKGAHTLLSYKEKKYFNSTGNPGMATGGSGDLLTGIISGLLAQGYDALEAAVLGTFIHGSAADQALIRGYTHETLTASVILTCFSEAILKISDNYEKL